MGWFWISGVPLNLDPFYALISKHVANTRQTRCTRVGEPEGYNTWQTRYKHVLVEKRRGKDVASTCDVLVENTWQTRAGVLSFAVYILLMRLRSTKTA